MSNRYSKYIPLGYEPVQPPLDVLAEVIKTKRQQNDSIEKALDDLGNVRINAIKDSFMEPRAHEIMKAWQNEKDSIVQEAVGQNNGDFTSVRRRVQKLKNDITSQVLNGEAGAIDSAYKDFQAKYQEYAKDFKDDPMRLSDQVKQYVSTLKAPQQFNQDLGRYDNVGSLTPPVSVYDVGKVGKEEAGAIPMQKLKTGYTTHEGLYDVQHTTESEFKDPTRISNALGTRLQQDPRYREATLWEGRNDGFKRYGLKPGSPEAEAYAQQYLTAKFELDKHSADNFGQFKILETEDENGNTVKNYIPVAGTVIEDKANAFKLKRTKDAGVDTPVDPTTLRPTRVVLPLVDNVIGSPKETGAIDTDKLIGAFGGISNKNKPAILNAYPFAQDIYGAVTGDKTMANNTILDKKIEDVWKDSKEWNKDSPKDILKKSIAQQNNSVPFNESLFDKLAQEGIRTNKTFGDVVNSYNDLVEKKYLEGAKNLPYAGTGIAYDNVDDQIEQTNKALVNKSAGVTIVKGGKVVKTAKDGYIVNDLMKDYGSKIVDNQGRVNDSPKGSRVTAIVGPQHFTDKPTRVIELGKDRWGNSITAYVDAEETHYQPENNPTVRAQQAINQGYTTGKSPFFGMAVDAQSSLGAEINTALGSNIVTRPMKVGLEIINTRKVPGRRVPVATYNIYDGSKATEANPKGQFLGTADLDEVPNQIAAEEDNTWTFANSTQTTTHYKGGKNETYTKKEIRKH